MKRQQFKATPIPPYKVAEEVSVEVGLPIWAIYFTTILTVVIMLGICFCCIRRCINKRRANNDKNAKNGEATLQKLTKNAEELE
nr:synaptotagmin 1-like [Onthophagus taurus]